MLATLTSDEAAGVGGQADGPVAGDGAEQSRRPSSPQRFVDANGVPIRIPKLAVRNRGPPDEANPMERPSIMMAYPRNEGRGSGPPSSRSSQSTSTPSSRNPSEDALPTQRSLALRNEQGSSTQTQPLKKKKKGGVLGFLTLKEPSTSAWEEFAEAEKQKARQKGTKPLAAGLPGVSSQKLPDYVPKVNSKWDGLPNSAKRTSIDSSKASSHRHRGSTFSTSTRRTDWTAVTSNSAGSAEARRAFGNPLQSPKFPDRSSTQPNTPWSPDDWRVSVSESARQSLAHGLQQQPIEESEENRPQTFLLPPSPEGHDKILLPDLPAALSPLTPLTPPELEFDDVQYLRGFNARMSQESEKATEMPATPPGVKTNAEPILVGIHYPELDSTNCSASIDFDQPPSPESKMSTAEPPTFTEFIRRNPDNFSRPRSRLATTPQSENVPSLSIDEVAEQPSWFGDVPVSPTLTNDSGRIDPFLTDTFASHSRETGHIPQRVASTVNHTPRRPLDTLAETDDTETSDEDDEDESADETPYTEEPDFSDDSPETARPTPAATTQHRPVRRSNSQASLAPSYAPSVMSEHWHMTPKERLGLGSKVRKSAVCLGRLRKT
ncbi:hypothetical protein LTR09_008713 [Extremus antarcticus]|uniref:Uncharacterized protein n=1 Tax=Extremus antarcticus TaxID=702011 RepID=A0AAJ0G644_9PEZI|nr:hypothetical protein LTR09_008713 [Extremus antarcticus]